MDPATLIGLALAFGALVTMITLEGASVTSILLPAPMILVFGATIAVGIASFTLKDSLRALKALSPAFRGKLANPQASIDQLVSLAEKARSKGLLSLEQEAAETSDPFLKKALQNIADGTDGDDLRIMMEDEIDTIYKLAHLNSKFYAALGGYAPTIGIVGTVVSLTHVLENLADPEHLGPMIATAFVATLWGLLSSNFIWLPISARIARMNDLNSERLNLQMEGLMAIQEGVQPLLLAERLAALVPSETKKITSKKVSASADGGRG